MAYPVSNFTPIRHPAWKDYADVDAGPSKMLAYESIRFFSTIVSRGDQKKNKIDFKKCQI